MVIKNIEIHTMDRENTVIERGYIQTDGGKITKIGEMSFFSRFTKEETINAEGMKAYPGLIDAHTHLGMYGDSTGFEGDDGNEDSEPIMPHLRAIDAINPLDRYFEEARNAGITTVITGPGSANAISGQLAAIKTSGKRIDKMIIKSPVGMKFALGENPKVTFSDKDQS